MNTASSPVTISHMNAQLGVLGLIPILSFDHTFNNFVIPAGGTANSGTISNVTLTVGVLSTVEILLLPELDVLEADITLGMAQNGVPSNFTLNLV